MYLPLFDLNKFFIKVVEYKHIHIYVCEYIGG